MRELHVVAVSEDGRHVVLAARRGASKGGFKLALDATLAAAVRGDLPRPGDEELPDLSPKEIQSRLRAGESVEKIARSAGVPLARVERFSGPVQGEMARMIDATRSAYVVRGRLGRSAVDLGTAVDAALHAGGADDERTDWSTYRQEDGSWLVTVSWYARKRSRSASWAYDPAQRLVTASDPASAALAHQESDEAAAKRKPSPSPARKPASKKTTAKKAPARKAAAKKAVKKAAPAKKAPAKKTAARAVKKAPAKKTVARAAVKRTPVKKAAAMKAPARPHRALRVVPDPEPRPTKPTKGSRGKTRASVPAWADVLLGTSPGGER
ncbi:MAG: DNA-binding protein [Frankiales bacterium]|nr:DNA-binding protein [Frankiales bacterium]